MILIFVISQGDAKHCVSLAAIQKNDFYMIELIAKYYQMVFIQFISLETLIQYTLTFDESGF